MSERCEWNQDDSCPAMTETLRAHHVHPSGCPNEAVWSVGVGTNNWHLCESCAGLPRFKRLRSRVWIGPRLMPPAEGETEEGDAPDA